MLRFLVNTNVHSKFVGVGIWELLSLAKEGPEEGQYIFLEKYDCSVQFLCLFVVVRCL